jgi:hypothetical protein
VGVADERGYGFLRHGGMGETLVRGGRRLAVVRHSAAEDVHYCSGKA